MEFRVGWEVDVEADTAEEAARIARSYQTNPETTALVFEVRDAEGTLTVVDLWLRTSNVIGKTERD